MFDSKINSVGMIFFIFGYQIKSGYEGGLLNSNLYSICNLFEYIFQ